MHLAKPMLANLQSLGFTTMTPVQQKTLPLILQQKDIIAQAKTGSGKTAAFGIGLVEKLNIESFIPEGLVICPTRELAAQVANELRRLARRTHNVKILTLCGGMPIYPQLRSLEHGAHIVVGTPGRLKDLVARQALNVAQVKTLVLDEADRMLDMGFAEDLESIAAELPSKRQTLLFSATFPDNVAKISEHIQSLPTHIQVDIHHEKKKIRQYGYEVSSKEKKDVILDIISHYNIKTTVVFCKTKVQCQDIADHLKEAGYYAAALHGDMEQNDRDEVLTLFANGSLSLLTATDVAARGIDIEGLEAVINFDISQDPEVHVHRIGRTGRKNCDGLAISLYTKKQQPLLAAIEKYIGTSIDRGCLNKLLANNPAPKPAFSSLRLEAGKKNKIRPGDILGALTKDAGLQANAVGKIHIFPYHTIVALDQSVIRNAVKHLNKSKVKGRFHKAKIIRAR